MKPAGRSATQYSRCGRSLRRCWGPIRPSRLPPARRAGSSRPPALAALAAATRRTWRVPWDSLLALAQADGSTLQPPVGSRLHLPGRRDESRAVPCTWGLGWARPYTSNLTRPRCRCRPGLWVCDFVWGRPVWLWFHLVLAQTGTSQKPVETPASLPLGRFASPEKSWARWQRRRRKRRRRHRHRHRAARRAMLRRQRRRHRTARRAMLRRWRRRRSTRGPSSASTVPLADSTTSPASSALPLPLAATAAARTSSRA